MDDDFYDEWDFYPDSRDATRRGFGLRVEVRGFQWANPQATNVIFWHYDISNEGTTDYPDNIIFGLYMDSGVGGSALSCDGIAESDDDNAYFDRSLGLNLTYTWDKFGHGTDLRGNCAPTGYLGYAYLETPGNPFDGLDDDDDGITDERRDGDPGTLIVGQDNIRAYVQATLQPREVRGVLRQARNQARVQGGSVVDRRREFELGGRLRRCGRRRRCRNARSGRGRRRTDGRRAGLSTRPTRTNPIRSV